MTFVTSLSDLQVLFWVSPTSPFSPWQDMVKSVNFTISPHYKSAMCQSLFVVSCSFPNSIRTTQPRKTQPGLSQTCHQIFFQPSRHVVMVHTPKTSPWNPVVHVCSSPVTSWRHTRDMSDGKCRDGIWALAGWWQSLLNVCQMLLSSAAFFITVWIVFSVKLFTIFFPLSFSTSLSFMQHSTTL